MSNIRNQSELRNFIRMISYENRMWSWIDGMHSFLLGENNVLNSLQRVDLTQLRKHFDFVNKFLTESKTINTYFNTNKEYIVRNMPANPIPPGILPGVPSGLPGGDFDPLELQWERFRLMAECMKSFGNLPDPDEGPCANIQENMPEGGPSQEDLGLCCFILLLKDLTCLFSIPSLKCFINLEKRMIALVRQALLERGCDCKISGPNPAGRACNHYCELVRKAEKKIKELEDKLEEAKRICKSMQQMFEPGGQFFDCIQVLNNRSNLITMRDRIMSLNPTNNTTRNSQSSSPSSPSSSPSTPSSSPSSSPSTPPSSPSGGGGGYGGY